MPIPFVCSGSSVWLAAQEKVRKKTTDADRKLAFSISKPTDFLGPFAQRCANIKCKTVARKRDVVLFVA